MRFTSSEFHNQSQGFTWGAWKTWSSLEFSKPSVNLWSACGLVEWATRDHLTRGITDLSRWPRWRPGGSRRRARWWAARGRGGGARAGGAGGAGGGARAAGGAAATRPSPGAARAPPAPASAARPGTPAALHLRPHTQPAGQDHR